MMHAQEGRRDKPDGPLRTSGSEAGFTPWGQFPLGRSSPPERITGASPLWSITRKTRRFSQPSVPGPQPLETRAAPAAHHLFASKQDLHPPDVVCTERAGHLLGFAVTAIDQHVARHIRLCPSASPRAQSEDVGDYARSRKLSGEIGQRVA